MDMGPTIVDRLSRFTLPPLIYDDIRPAWHRRRADTQRHSSHHLPGARIIPIKVEHIPAAKPMPRRSLKSYDNRVDFDSLTDIDSDCVVLDSSDIPELKSSWKKEDTSLSSVVKGSNIRLRDESPIFSENVSKSETLNLTDVPPIINDKICLSRSGTSTSDVTSAGKWTVIPICHVKTQSFPNSEKELTKIKSPDEKLHVVEENDLPKSTVQGHKRDGFTKSVDVEDVEIDLLSTCTEKATGLSSLLDEHDMITGPAVRDSLFTEKEVNPIPTYPVYAELKKRLTDENRKIDYIRGDGNCFFRALSKQLYGSEKFHKAVRNLVVDIMATNKSWFSQFIDNEDVQAHLERMSEENTWATTCEIYAAATLLQRDIYMLTPDHNNTHYSWLLFKPLFTPRSSSSHHNTRSKKTNSNERAGNTVMQNADIDIRTRDRTASESEDNNILGFREHPCYLTLCNTNGNHYDRVVADHCGCNCFLPCPRLEGQLTSIDLT